MTRTETGIEGRKREAALAALELIEDGSLVGLGTGSTARYLIEELGNRLTRGALRRVKGVPTSLATERLALKVGIPLLELPPEGVDVAVDGMDEVDPHLRAIKGLGGALAREKIVAASARLFILIGDAGKRVQRLGELAPVPVEVLPFGWRRTTLLLERLGTRPVLRGGEEAPFRSDNGNLVLDCHLPGDADPVRLSAAISQLPGVVEHGLFLEEAGLAFVASERGVEELRRPG